MQGLGVRVQGLGVGVQGVEVRVRATVGVFAIFSGFVSADNRGCAERLEHPPGQVQYLQSLALGGQISMSGFG